MKGIAPLLLALAVAPPTAWVTHALAAGGPGGSAPPGPAAAGGKSERAADDSAHVARLEARLGALGGETRSRAEEGRRRAVDALEPTVLAALAARGVRVDPRAIATAREAAVAELSSALARVGAEEDALALAATVAELEEAGLVEAVLEELRARSEADPADAEAALLLARVAAAEMDTAPYGPQSLRYADEAGAAYARALQAAPERDGVRLERARLLARTPAFLGRRGEAIEELDRVISNGESGGRPRPEAYALLGTLLLEQGARARALETWNRGAGNFPDDEGLRRLLELHGQR